MNYYSQQNMNRQDSNLDIYEDSDLNSEFFFGPSDNDYSIDYSDYSVEDVNHIEYVNERKPLKAVYRQLTDDWKVIRLFNLSIISKNSNANSIPNIPEDIRYMIDINKHKLIMKDLIKDVRSGALSINHALARREYDF